MLGGIGSKNIYQTCAYNFAFEGAASNNMPPFSTILENVTNVVEQVADLTPIEGQNTSDVLETYHSLINSRSFRPNSLQEYKSLVSSYLTPTLCSGISSKLNGAPAETGTINPSTYIQGTTVYDDVVNSMNFEDEWQNFLQSRGCANEEELQVLNSSPMWRTMDQLKRAATSAVTSVFLNMSAKDPSMTSALFHIKDVVNSASTSDLVNFTNSLNKDFNTTAKATQNLLEKTNNTGISEDYLNKISKGIDKLLEKIKEEQKNEKQGEPLDFKKYQRAYQTKMIAKYQR